MGRDSELYDHIVDSGYIVYDTEYLFRGDPTAESEALFTPSRKGIVLSTGMRAWKGFRRKPWGNFKQEFSELKKSCKMIQTDLACINTKYIDEFLEAVSFLSKFNSEELPAA